MSRRFSFSSLSVGAWLLALSVAGCATAPGTDEDEVPVLSADEEAQAWEQAWQERETGGEKADSAECSGVRVPDRGPFGKKIALTFDDGPNPATTPDVIATLHRHGVPGTFFVNGSRIKGDAERALLAEMAADPTIHIGNHTWSHVNMAEQGSAEVARQIDKTTEVIEAAGVQARYFRFPFGSSTCATAQAVRDRGMAVVGWHLDSADWCFAAGGGVCKASTFRYVPDAYRQDMKGYVLSQAKANGGGVMLFHDIHRSTANALDGIIETLKAEGFTFTGLDDVNTFPKLNGSSAPPAPTVFIGDACKAPTDCTFEIWGQTGTCHAAGFCVIGCEGFCPDQAGKAGTFCVQDPFQTAAPAGVCVPQSVSQNGHCADLPGTIDASADRYIGTSNATAKSAEVCMPVVQ